MEIVFFWIMFTILVGIIASKRNRSVIGWVVSSLFITPFMAVLFILVLGTKETA